MDAREQRGLAIAQSLPLRQKKGMWIVPSQAGKGQYVVDHDPNGSQCTCPDYEMRGMKCKHIFAVEFAIERQQHKDGSATVTQMVTVTDTVKKPTYPQVWPAYNAAQTHEKEKFLSLLADLCRGIHDETPPPKDARACPWRMPSSRRASRSIAPFPADAS